MPGEKPPQNGKKESETPPPEIPGLPPEPTLEKSKAGKGSLKEAFARFIDEKEVAAGRIIQKGTAPEGQESTPSEPEPAEVDYVRVQTPQGARLQPVGEIGFTELQPAETRKTENAKPEETRLPPNEKRERVEADIAQEKKAYEETESRYLEAYKEHMRNRRFLKKEPVELLELKTKYNLARLEYAKALENSASTRIQERYQDNSPEKGQLVMERYNRIVRYREVIGPAAEKKLAARFEALDSRGKNVFHKGLTWVGAQNAKLETWAGGKTRARAIRAVGTTVLIGGGALAAGAFGAAGALAVAGWGAWRTGRVFVSALAAGTLGEVAARGVDAGLQRVWQQKSRNIDRRGERSLEMADLEQLDKQQGRITKNTNEITRAKQRMITRALVGLGVGAGTAEALANWPGMQSLAEGDAATKPDATTAEKGTQEPAETTPAEAKEELREKVWQVEEAQKSVGAESPAEATPESPKATEVEKSPEPMIDEEGEGANSMFWELRKQIEHQPETQRSELAQHIFTEMTPEQWSQTLGFFKIENGEVINRIMHEGDRLFMSPQGELVFHDNFVNPPKGEEIVLMNARGEIQPGAIERIQAGIPDAPAAPTATQGAVVASTEMSSAVPTVVPERVGAVAPLESVVAAPVAGANQGLSIEDTLSGSEPAYVPAEPKLPSGELTIDDVIGASGATPNIVPEASPHGASEPLTVDNVINNQISTNGFGVEINPNEPARYSWRLPGSNAEYQVVHGGTPEAESALAREHVANHPGSTVFFTDVRYNEFGQPIEYMRAWTSSATGKVEIMNNPPNPVTMQELLPVAQPNDFVRKLNQ